MLSSVRQITDSMYRIVACALKGHQAVVYASILEQELALQCKG